MLRRLATVSGFFGLLVCGQLVYEFNLLSQAHDPKYGETTLSPPGPETGTAAVPPYPSAAS